MQFYDHFYESDAARYLRMLMEDVLNIEVNIDPRLHAPAMVDPNLRAIWLRPGLSFDVYHWFVTRAHMALTYPDMIPEPTLRRRPEPAVSGDALIIPLHIRPDLVRRQRKDQRTTPCQCRSIRDVSK